MRLYRIKDKLMQLIGVVAFFAFLVMCADIAPGEEMSEWNFIWPKLVAMAVIGGCVWAINKLDSKR